MLRATPRTQATLARLFLGEGGILLEATQYALVPVGIFSGANIAF